MGNHVLVLIPGELDAVCGRHELVLVLLVELAGKDLLLVELWLVLLLLRDVLLLLG